MTHDLRRAVAGTLFLAALSPSAAAHFEEGQIWIVDQLNSRLYFANPDTWNVNISLDSTDGLAGPAAIGFNLHGEMLVGNYAASTVFEIDGDLGSATVLTAEDGLAGPFGGNGIAIGPGDGDIYVTNFDSKEIRRFDAAYQTSTVFADAGDGLVSPGALAFLPDGDLLIADRGVTTGRVHHADPAGNVTTFFDPPTGERPIAVAARNNYDVYVLMMSGKLIRMIGGDPADTTLLGTYGPPALRGSIAFGPEYDVLYQVSDAESAVRIIDPDSGVSHVPAMIPQGGGGTSMVVVGSHVAPGSFVEFGDPLAGAGGIAPTLEGAGQPRTGDPFSLELRKFVGGSVLFTFLGVAPTEQTLLGAEFHIDTTQFFKLFIRSAGGTPGVPGEGSFDFTFNLPDEPSLVFASLYFQALGTDDAAPQGAAFTACLEAYIGE